MKKINARVTTKNIIIAEITISDEEKKLIGLTCYMIAEKYMETNFPGMDDWKWEKSFVFDDESDVTGHWLITIHREVKTLIFDEKE